MPLVSKPLGSAEPWKAPSYEEICQKTFEAFGFYPCLWQIRVVEAILKHDRDVINIAATGSGKTLTFWMPLLFHKGGIQMVMTPLIHHHNLSNTLLPHLLDAWLLIHLGVSFCISLCFPPCLL